MTEEEHERGPELIVIRPSDFAGWEERKAERDRVAAEARRRYHDHLVHALNAVNPVAPVDDRAETILGALFDWKDDDGQICSCSCHPHLPTGDLHDHGFDCTCRHTPEQRRAHWEEWQAEMDAYWDSDEGRRITAAGQAEEDDLEEWLKQVPGVKVASHGGFAPEQWWGSVDGHSFFFRERHDQWRIELDLRPARRFHRVWVGGPLDEDSSFELRQSEEGTVIAEGVTGVPGYGSTPRDRAQMIVSTIRDHLGRQVCQVHTAERDDLELLFGRQLHWCPECGTRLGTAAR